MRVYSVAVPGSEIGERPIELQCEVYFVSEPTATITAYGRSDDLVRGHKFHARPCVAVPIRTAANIDQQAAARPWRKTKASEAGSGSGSQFSSHTAVESHRVVSGTDSLISVRENRGVITPVSAGRDTQRPAQRQNRNILVTGDPASAEVSQAEALDSGMRVAISSGESRGIRTPE